MKKVAKIGSVFLWRAGNLIPLKRQFLQTSSSRWHKKRRNQLNQKAEAKLGAEGEIESSSVKSGPKTKKD